MYAPADHELPYANPRTHDNAKLLAAIESGSREDLIEAIADYTSKLCLLSSVPHITDRLADWIGTDQQGANKFISRAVELGLGLSTGEEPKLSFYFNQEAIIAIRSPKTSLTSAVEEKAIGFEEMRQY